MAFKEELAEAIVQVQESEDGSGVITNTTSALTGAITNRLDQGMAVLKRQAKDNYKGKFVGGDGINEATIIPASYTAVLKNGGTDYAMYISDVRVELYHDTTKPGRGRTAYLDMCFDEDVHDALLKVAKNHHSARKTDTKEIEKVIKKYANKGVTVVSVKQNSVG